MAFLKSPYPPTWIGLKEKAGMGTKACLDRTKGSGADHRFPFSHF